MPDMVWHTLEYFERDEFEYPNQMMPQLLRQLDSARRFADVPFVITSDFRPGDKKAHGRGNAVDIRCRDSHTRYRILKGLFMMGFERIGIYDKHIHADIDPLLPGEVSWTGESK